MQPNKCTPVTALFLFCLTLLGSVNAQAQATPSLAVKLKEETKTVPASGGVVVFGGSVQNVSQAPLSLYIDADSISAPAGYAVTDYFMDYLLWDSPSGVIEPGQTYSADLFQIVVPAGASSFCGFFTVFDSTTGNYAQTKYTVIVTPVPSPPSASKGRGFIPSLGKKGK